MDVLCCVLDAADGCVVLCVGCSRWTCCAVCWMQLTNVVLCCCVAVLYCSMLDAANGRVVLYAGCS